MKKHQTNQDYRGIGFRLNQTTNEDYNEKKNNPKDQDSSIENQKKKNTEAHNENPYEGTLDLTGSGNDKKHSEESTDDDTKESSVGNSESKKNENPTEQNNLKYNSIFNQKPGDGYYKKLPFPIDPQFNEQYLKKEVPKIADDDIETPADPKIIEPQDSVDE